MGNSCQRWLKLFAVHLLGALGRHKACPYDGGAGVRTRVAVSTVPIVHDDRAYDGGRCGGNPPAQGRAEGPTAQLQSSVISGEWSEGTAVALLGYANWL